MLTGKIHSYETFGAADGPGVRFIVFLHGCAFRCAYCHNPDTWASPPAFEASADDVLARALRYRSYWREEGGITVSGGEPMLQPEFVAELFEKAHAAGATTCLDTSAGPFSRDPERFPLFERLFAATDTTLLDLKLLDPAAHRKLTGADNASVLDCARYLAERKKDVWVRRVLVPGVTDGEDDLKATGAFIRSLGNVKRVDVLPYHTLGVEKWRALGIPYRLEGVEPPTAESVARARALLSLV
jgi:pyruvate formate lyase activating enzyme